MSGHNKWSTIKHKKAATDAKRGKIFSKLAKEIMVAARTGGGDPDANITLRAIIQKARGENMPMDNIERAIKKGTGDMDGVQLEEMAYEGYAPGGVAVIVEVLTDNKNRSAAEVRHVFTKSNASLAGQGSVARMFQRKGQIIVEAEKVGEEKLMDLVLEAGAEDMQTGQGYYEVLTDPSQFMDVVDACEKAGIELANSEVILYAEETIPVVDKAHAAGILKFVEMLEDLDDVQNVYHNADIDDSIAAELEE